MTSFIFKSFVFALAASTVFALAAPAPEVAALETNAQRLAAGLNPASPRNLKSTKVERRHVVAPSPSPSPCQKSGLRRLRRSAEQTYSGIICVQYPGNDTLIGYVSRSFTSDGYYTVSRDPDMALEVSFKAGHFKHTDLRISTPQDDDLPFLGAVTSSTPSYNVTGSPLGPNRAHLGFTSRTPIMSPPAPLPASSYSSSQTPMSQTQFNAYESAIWNVDVSTAQLTPAWVNPDGKLVEKAVAVHEPAQGTFAITSENGTGDDAVAVTFYFEFSS